MATRQEIMATLKKQYPTLRIGDEDQGYTDLNPKDYETQIEEWADNAMALEAKAAEAMQATADKAALLAKLGMSADEAKLLLS